MKVRSNPSGKKNKVNELLKRLKWVIEFDKDLETQVHRDYVAEIVNDTKKIMKDEGIMTMEQNWVLYTLHTLIFYHVYYAASEKIHEVYRSMTEKHGLDMLITMKKETYSSIFGIFNFALTGNLHQFLWMVVDNKENSDGTFTGQFDESDPKNKDLVSFAVDFKNEMQRLVTETDLKLLLGLIRHYYKFFKDDIEPDMKGSGSVGAGMEYNNLVQIHKQSYSNNLTKEIVSVMAHFYGQASVLEIKKIKNIQLLPTSRSPAPFFPRLRKYFNQYEIEALRKLESERGNKFIPKQFIDWGETIMSWHKGRSSFVWESLKKPYSQKEGQWALHCGNSTRQGSRDNIFSLREIIGEKSKICVTVTAERQNDGTFVLRESKGVGNNKPSEEYWPMIVELWMNKDANFSSITGDGYWTENNLHFQDLSKDLKEYIIKNRPDLLTGFHYALSRGDALDGLKLVQMNFESGSFDKYAKLGGQVNELLQHFLFKEKPTVLTYSYLSRRRYDNADDKRYEKDTDTYISNAIRKVKVKSFTPKDARELIPYEAYEFLDSMDIAGVWGNATNAIENLVTKVDPIVIENLLSAKTFEYADIHFPNMYLKKITQDQRSIHKDLTVIDKGFSDRFSDVSPAMIDWLSENHPECLSKKVIRRFPLDKYLDVVTKKYGLSRGKTEHDEEARIEKLEGLFEEWIHNHPTSHNLEVTGVITQAEAKAVLKKYPFLKSNLTLQIISDGNAKKTVKKLIAAQDPKNKAQLVLREVDGVESLVFHKFGIEEALDEIGNDNIKHLQEIVDEGFYEISDIGMSDRDLRVELSQFSGYVYKHNPTLYAPLSHWFEDMEKDSPEWDTEDGEKIISCIRSAYYSGYEVGAYDDCYEELIEYYKNEFKEATDYELDYVQGEFLISVPVSRLHKILNSYWLDRQNYTDLVSFLFYDYKEVLPAKSYRGRDIDSFSWDAAYERFLEELNEKFGE